jgi:4'-phosphopantetheinyl transferase
MSATVHVWIIDLDDDAAPLSRLLSFLSGEEQLRAARFHTSQHRGRFIVAHGALRSILAGYTNVEPGSIRLATTPTGKPFIPGMSLGFNLSHSDGLAICAVTSAGEIGADVERIRPTDDADLLVEQFFAAAEQRQYRTLDARERIAAFYSIWTRKEAFVKATGAGLEFALQSVEVEVSPEATRPRLVSSALPPGRWTLRSFVPRPDYIAAVALDRDIAAMELFDWSLEGVRYPLT